MPDVLRIADLVGERWRALVLTAAWTGLRFGELAALRRPLLDLDAAEVRVVGERGAPLRSSGFGTRVWRPAVLAAGLPGVHFHDLRHVAGTLAAQSGASVRELMARLGHASSDASLRYLHATSTRDRAVAAAVSGTVSAARVTRTG